jgi:hypothetical protein
LPAHVRPILQIVVDQLDEQMREFATSNASNEMAPGEPVEPIAGDDTGRWHHGGNPSAAPVSLQ